MQQIERTTFNEGYRLGLRGAFFDKSRQDYTPAFERGYYCGRDRLSQYIADLKRHGEPTESAVFPLPPIAEQVNAQEQPPADQSNTSSQQ